MCTLPVCKPHSGGSSKRQGTHPGNILVGEWVLQVIDHFAWWLTNQ